MDYTRGYTAAFSATLVDTGAWMDTETVDIMSGSIKRENTGLRHSAQITVRDFPENTETYMRIYMDIKQDGELEHIPLFTGLATSPERDIEGAIESFPLEIYSVLKPLEDLRFARGYYVTAGMTAGAAIRRLLQGLPAPYEIEPGSPVLLDYIVAEDNENPLTMIDRILKASGWQLTIDGSGTIHVGPKPEAPKMTMSPEQDIIERSVKVKHDWYTCPNIFRASSGDAYAVARDDDPDSMLSTMNRGREVIASESNVSLASEGIAEYANRKLKELQNAAESADYTRRFVPDLNIGDIVELNYDQIKGDYTITSQTIQLTHNAQTQETVERALVFR